MAHVAMHQAVTGCLSAAPVASVGGVRTVDRSMPSYSGISTSSQPRSCSGVGTRRSRAECGSQQMRTGCWAEMGKAEEPLSGVSPVGRRELLLGAGVLAGGLSMTGATSLVLPDSALAADSPPEWERINLGTEKGVVLLDIAFVPAQPNRGYLLGNRQTLLETTDYGKTWGPRSIPSAKDEDFNYRFISLDFAGNEGWIVGKPAILLYTSDGGDSWARVPLSARLPGNPVRIKATGPKSAEMVTDEGAIYVTSNGGYNWKAAVEETVAATLNRTVSSGISGASYYTGSFSAINRSPDGVYVAVSSRGNFYMTWEPGQAYWQPHNRTSGRRLQNVGFRGDGGLWLLVRGGGMFLGRGADVSDEDYVEAKILSRGFGLLDVGFRNKDEGYAVGGSGVLLKTVDGGQSWRKGVVKGEVPGNLYTVKFMGDNQGFILGNDGLLLRYLG